MYTPGSILRKDTAHTGTSHIEIKADDSFHRLERE